MSENDTAKCLNCDASEQEIPLVSVRFAGRQVWFCSNCMPVLIHRGEELRDKLGGSATG